MNESSPLQMKTVLIHSGNYDNYRNMVLQFGQTIYQEAFPVDNEREDMESICERVCNSPAGDVPLSFIILGQIPSGEIAGGLIADWYKDCASLELIYLAVGKNYRRNGFGKQLLHEGVQKICSFLEVDVKAVYLETENPELVMDSDSVIDPVERLRFFDKCGVRRIPINYVQPPLSYDKEFVRHLFLCVLPVENKDHNLEMKIAQADVSKFIIAFYKGLKQVCPPKYEKQFEDEQNKLLRHVEQLADNDLLIPLSHLVERPKFIFYGWTLTAHFAVSACSDDVCGKETNPCITFHSYECDLFNYSHQRKPAFQTHHLGLLENAELFFPDYYRYSSEGQEHFRVCDARRKSVKVDISMNWSVKNITGENIKDRIVHLTFTPHTSPSNPQACETAKTSYFTELELIKLVAGLRFGSLQENFSCAKEQGVSFYIRHPDLNGGTQVPLNELAKHLFGDSSLVLDSSHAGITEINASQVFAINDLSNPLEQDVIIPEHIQSKKIAPAIPSFAAYLQQVDDENLDESDWNKVLCGIILGIFDFERMNSPEICDTIRVVFKRKELFSILSRGHILELISGISPRERDENIFVSPYLLIPSAALLFNEILMERINEVLTKSDSTIQEDMEHDSKLSIWRSVSTFFSFADIKAVNNQIRKATECHKKVSLWLTEEYMTDVFQYQSEKDFLTKGLKERGLCSKEELNKNRLAILSDHINELRQSNEDYRSNRLNVLLFLFAVLQVIVPYMSEQFKHYAPIFAIIALVLIIYLYDVLQRKKR